MGNEDSRAEHPLIKRGPVLLTVLVVAWSLVLCFMRAVAGDEHIYLHEVVTMVDCLRRGVWFGNEAVGLHGFIFKLPAALLLLVFKDSIMAATLTTVALAGAACWLCLEVLRSVTRSSMIALLGAWLVVTNYHFVMTAPTFMRDIPALFAALLLVYGMIRGWNRWALGLCFMLLLDAKEYVCFLFIPAFLLWIVFDEMFGAGQRSPAATVHMVISRWTAGLLPSLVYLVLMLCTGIVPINMFAAYLMGLLDRGITVAADQMRLDMATANQWGNGREIGRLAVPAWQSSMAFINEAVRTVIGVTNVVLSYFGKTLYPRTLSFIAIPRLIFLPAFVMSIVGWRRAWRAKDALRLAFPLFIWVYLIIYLLRTSHGRYLLTIMPFIAYFFMEFLYDQSLTRSFKACVFWAALLFSALGLCFEHNYVWIKVGINAVMFGMLAVTVFADRAGGPGRAMRVTLPLGLGLVTSAVSLAASLLLPSQLGNYLAFGTNWECPKVLAELDPEKRIWINDPGWRSLPRFYLKDGPMSPEWCWSLAGFVPKHYMLNSHDTRYYGFKWCDWEEFKEYLGKYGIEEVGLLVSKVERFPFIYQGYLKAMLRTDWLKLRKKVELKNKTLYLFDCTAPPAETPLNPRQCNGRPSKSCSVATSSR